MEPKSSTKKKDPTPILFSSPPVSPLKSPIQSTFDDEARPQAPPENGVYVYLQLIEVNNLKVKNKTDFEQQRVLTSELSFKKREHSFLVSKDEIKQSKYLRGNYLPADNLIEIPVSVNMNIPHPSFDTMERIIRAIVEKEKKNSSNFPLNVNNANSVEMFAGACVLNMEDLATFIYQTIIKPTMNLKQLVEIMLIALESSIPKLYMEFYKIFREYVIANKGWSEPSAMVQKIKEQRDDVITIFFENSMYTVHKNEVLQFAFPEAALKKPFETYRSNIYRQFFSPEQKYYTLNVQRKRFINGDDGIFDSGFPHKYYLINPAKHETIITAVREAQYGDFYLFGKEEWNNMRYGSNYVGQIIANPWGTAFDVYDDGVSEEALSILPKYITVLRTKIATISYETNILGDVPREIRVSYLDFADKTPGKLVPMAPKYDAEKDCYTLNFYGKAKLASARNFILTFPENQENIILMQGKCGKDLFNLDFRHPLNFAQAFSISLASIGKKFFVS